MKRIGNCRKGGAGSEARASTDPPAHPQQTGGWNIADAAPQTEMTTLGTAGARLVGAVLNFAVLCGRFRQTEDLAEQLEKPVAEVERMKVVNSFQMAKKRLRHLFEIVEARDRAEEDGGGSSSNDA